MTPTPAPAPAPPARPVPATPAAGSARAGRLRRTPARLRLAAAVAVVACALVAVGGLLVGLVQADALRSAADDTAQQVRTLDVRNDLVAADATATNAFLVGGREPVAQRERYDVSLASATSGLTAVAGADQRDAGRLPGVSTSVATYSGLVEQARANNRQGFPVGAAYLETASQELRAEALPGLDEVVSANASSVTDAFRVAGRATLVLLVVVVALVALVVVQVWLASRTHRRLNLGLVLSTVVLLVAGFLLGSNLDGGSRTASDVQDGAYGQTVAVARAYSLANDAKAAESFTLIKRGSGQAYEESYQASVDAASELLEGVGGPVQATFDAWAATHDEIRGLDDGGDWDGAVALATSSEPGSPNAQFDAFAQEAQTATADSSAQAQSDLEHAASASERTAWLALVAGLLAAGAAVWGFAPRLKEYR